MDIEDLKNILAIRFMLDARNLLISMDHETDFYRRTYAEMQRTSDIIDIIDGKLTPEDFYLKF